MNAKKNVFIALGIALFMLILTFTFYKIAVVPDVNWDKNYGFENKDVHGFWAFKTLLKQQHGDTMVNVVETPTFHELDSNKAVIIVNSYVDIEQDTQLLEWVKRGNSLYIISEYFSILLDSISVESDTLYAKDTLECLTYSNSDSFIFKNYYENFHISQKVTFHPVVFKVTNYDSISYSQDIVTVRDTVAICSQLHYGKGTFIMHSIPSMFCNLATKQDFFIRHMNEIFGSIENKKIELTKSYYAQHDDESPLQVLLKYKSLSAAYYTILFTGILFILFAAKRKMKTVPVVSEITNTTLEHVDTVARLYESQGRHIAMVKKMEDNFYHKINQHYFIHKNEDAFVSQLSKKTKVSEELVLSILNSFKTIYEKQHCSDFDLNSLYNYLTTFENKLHNGRNG